MQNQKLNRILFIGRLTDQKRPEWIIEISSKSNVDAEIVGDGLLRGALQEDAATKKNGIHFSGQTRDPWSLVRPGDLLIVPSAYEGDGLVVIEGLKANIPMLLSDISDFRRFGLPERNYCKNIEDFVTRIDQFRENLASLVVPEDICNAILAPRSIEVVGDAWERFLTRHHG